MHKQKGFSVVEILLVLVVIGIAGIGGWYVWSKNSNDEPPKNSTQTQTNQVGQKGKAGITEAASEEEKPKATFAGETHTSSQAVFNMTILNGWTVETDSTYDIIFQYSTDKLVYNKSVKPVLIETTASGVGGFVTGIRVSVNEYNTKVEQGDTFVLDDGTTGFCENTVTAKADDTLDLMRDDAGNFINKRCTFTKNGHNLEASYSYYEKEPINVEAVEYAFRTITILN